jgi:ribosome-associated heat shock protein Hsp15
VSEEGVRLDKWLWAARLFKTRRLAVEAIAGGKVHVQGVRAKPAKTVRPGDEVSVRKGPYEHVVVVRALSEKRGPAPVAAQLYEETAQSKAAVEALRARLRLEPAGRPQSSGRPTKRERRHLQDFKQNRDDS